jgi:hypothetical protein
LTVSPVLRVGITVSGFYPVSAHASERAWPAQILRSKKRLAWQDA